MVKIAICDDEKVFYNELHLYLNEFSKIRNIDIIDTYFSNGIDLIASDIDFDLIFMDYKMESLNGLETARILRSKNKNAPLIFLTSYPKIVFQSFEVNTFRFLIKPVKQDELFKAFDDYLDSIDNDLLLSFKTDDGIFKLRLSEIIYAEALGKHTILRTATEQYECTKYLQEIEKILPSENFFRCHKSFIVNFEHIQRHDNQIIYLDNNERCKIGRTCLTSFKYSFQKYIIRYNGMGW